MLVDIFPASLKSRGRRGNAPVQTQQRHTVKKCAVHLEDCTQRVCSWDDVERPRSRHEGDKGKESENEREIEMERWKDSGIEGQRDREKER